MNKYNLNILICLFTCIYACNQKKSFSISSYFDELGISGKKVLVLNIDFCTSCVNDFQKPILEFIENSQNEVLILSSSLKKTSFFIELNNPNVFWDKPHELIENGIYSQTPLVIIFEGEKYSVFPISNPELLNE